MVMTADLEHPISGPRRTGSGLVLTMDRSRSFRAARRHTLVVRTLRVALPSASAALLAVYAFALFGPAELSTQIADIAATRIKPGDLAMHNPHYEGFTDDGGSYRVSARSAQIDPTKPDLVKLNGIEGDLIDASKSKTRLSAASGSFHLKNQSLWLEGQIEVRSETGLRADLASAAVNTKEGIVKSAKPVRVSFPGGTVTSKEMTIRQKSREVAFVDNVVAKLNPAAKPATEAAPSAAVASDAPKLFGASDKPVDITSSRLDIHDADKVAIFTGDVRATQADAVLSTPEMTVSYTGGALPSGADKVAPPEPGAPPAGDGKISQIVAKGPVVMTRGATERVTSQSATFHANTQTAELGGGVLIEAGTDRRASGDRATLDQKADTALIEGNVVVVQGENVLRGRKLFINRATGVAELIAPPMDGNGPGRISVRLVQNAKDAASGGANKAKSSKVAPSAVAPDSFRADPSQPLDLEADALEVRDQAKMAIFRGAVSARQGSFQMEAQEIEAHYTGSASLADVSAPSESGASSTGAAGEKTALTRLEARRKVVIQSGDGRKVSGDWATYDAADNKMVVGGAVELTQGRNVVQGTRLVVDLTTGHSTIDSQSPGQASPKAGGGWETSAGEAPPSQGSVKSRPSAIFFPKEIKDGSGQKAKAKAAPKPASQTSEWSVETAPAAPERRDE